MLLTLRTLSSQITDIRTSVPTANWTTFIIHRSIAVCLCVVLLMLRREILIVVSLCIIASELVYMFIAMYTDTQVIQSNITSSNAIRDMVASTNNTIQQQCAAAYVSNAVNANDAIRLIQSKITSVQQLIENMYEKLIVLNSTSQISNDIFNASTSSNIYVQILQQLTSTLNSWSNTGNNIVISDITNIRNKILELQNQYSRLNSAITDINNNRIAVYAKVLELVAQNNYIRYIPVTQLALLYSKSNTLNMIVADYIFEYNITSNNIAFAIYKHGLVLQQNIQQNNAQSWNVNTKVYTSVTTTNDIDYKSNCSIDETLLHQAFVNMNNKNSVSNIHILGHKGSLNASYNNQLINNIVIAYNGIFYNVYTENGLPKLIQRYTDSGTTTWNSNTQNFSDIVAAGYTTSYQPGIVNAVPSSVGMLQFMCGIKESILKYSLPNSSTTITNRILKSSNGNTISLVKTVNGVQDVRLLFENNCYIASGIYTSDSLAADMAYVNKYK
jgi:hypothetical protein